jgi:hypothetical protein
MSTYQDEWGHDPSVRLMRRLFARMEGIQTNILKRTGVSLFDLRVRSWRERALKLFEQARELASSKGWTMREDNAGVLYGHCLAKVLRAEKIFVPEEAVPSDEAIQKVLEEVMP